MKDWIEFNYMCVNTYMVGCEKPLENKVRAQCGTWLSE